MTERLEEMDKCRSADELAMLRKRDRERLTALERENAALREVLKGAEEALKAVKKEVIESDINDFENKTLGTCKPANANLTLRTREACEEALALISKGTGDGQR